jgi:hypothetical protein
MIILRTIGIVLLSVLAAALVALRFQNVRHALFRVAPRTQRTLDRVYPVNRKTRPEAPPTYGQA